MFSNEQIAFMKKIGLSVSFSDHMTDNEYIAIEEAVSDHLQKHGFDRDYKPTKEGIMCESILDLL